MQCLGNNNRKNYETENTEKIKIIVVIILKNNNDNNYKKKSKHVPL